MQPTRILVVFTGGTIGSRVSGDLINVVPGQTYRLLNDFTAAARSPFEFHVIEPANILSENARPRDWTTIARAVLAGVTDEHAGVVVTHGTDTLAFSAAALGFALAGLTVPVVLVSSDRPLDDPNANGPSNFSDAVDMIAGGTPGVFVTYRNPDGRRLVHRGTRVLPPSPLDHFVLSACGSHVAEFGVDGDLRWVPDPALRPDPSAVIENPSFSEDVVFVHPYPGLNYERIDLSGCNAVVHDLYHSGTASTVSGAYDILEFASRCQDAGIPLYCAPGSARVQMYGSSAAFAAAGIIPVTLVRADVAYVKACFGVGLGLRGEELTEFLCRRNVAGEFIES